MSRVTFACNSASAQGCRHVERLDYQGSGEQRVRIGLPRLVDNLLHLQDRYLDLLEIAAYVYAADRFVRRGRLEAVEYHSWAREMEFRVRVRDHNFWLGERELAELLSDALNWMTGDRQHRFRFSSGHTTPPANLFDSARVPLPRPVDPPAVLPFSGGLDSLAGALTLLNETDRTLVLVSHQAQSRTKKTQDSLVAALKQRYGTRISFYPFECTLAGHRAKEETQRSRSFLYTAVALVVALAHGSRRIYVFENGVTSLNLARRQDLMNARASRTTHPQTLGRLARFFSAFADEPIQIDTPFVEMTKADVMRRVKTIAPDLLSSSVSCAATFKHLGQATQCGECFQCIDRRIAGYAANCEQLDHAGLYSVDVMQESFSDRSARTTAVDYLRQAAFLRNSDEGELEGRHLAELGELLNWIPIAGGDLDKTSAIHRLLERHGHEVASGLVRMRDVADDVFGDLVEGSLLHVVAIREHLRPEVLLLCDRVEEILKEAVPRMFRRVPPKNESDLNAKVNALLATHLDDLTSEHPLARFACAAVIPDHEAQKAELLIEAKYIRNRTTPSKATEGISSDLSKFPEDAFILFLVLDQHRAIPDDREFVRDIERRRDCRVVVIH